MHTPQATRLRTLAALASLVTLVTLTSLLVACTPPSTTSPEEADGRTRPPSQGSPTSSQSPATKMAPAAMAPPPKVDVVLTLTSGAVSSPDVFAADVAAVLERIASARADLRLAVIGPRAVVAGALPGLEAKLGPERFRAIDLALQPNEVRPVAVAAACHVDASDFQDNHGGVPTPPRICGHDFSTLTGKPPADVAHHWLWTIQPVRGVLHDFLREGAHRRFVFISRDDDFVDLFTDAAFSKAMEAAPRPASFDVTAIVPVAALSPETTPAGGPCVTESARRFGVTPSVRLAALASATSGVVREFCAPGWSGHAEAIGKQIERQPANAAR